MQVIVIYDRKGGADGLRQVQGKQAQPLYIRNKHDGIIKITWCLELGIPLILIWLFGRLFMEYS